MTLCACHNDPYKELTKDEIDTSAYIYGKYQSHNFEVRVENIQGRHVRHAIDEDGVVFEIFKDDLGGYSDNYMDAKYLGKLESYANGIVESYGDEAIDCFKECSVNYCISNVDEYGTIFDTYGEYLDYAKQHGTLSISYNEMLLTSLDDYNMQLDTAIYYLKEQSGFKDVEIVLDLPSGYKPVFLLGNDPDYRDEVLRRSMIEVFGPEVFEDEQDESN